MAANCAAILFLFALPLRAQQDRMLADMMLLPVEKGDLIDLVENYELCRSERGVIDSLEKLSEDVDSYFTYISGNVDADDALDVFVRFAELKCTGEMVGRIHSHGLAPEEWSCDDVLDYSGEVAEMCSHEALSKTGDIIQVNVLQIESIEQFEDTWELLGSQADLDIPADLSIPPTVRDTRPEHDSIITGVKCGGSNISAFYNTAAGFWYLVWADSFDYYLDDRGMASQARNVARKFQDNSRYMLCDSGELVGIARPIAVATEFVADPANLLAAGGAVKVAKGAKGITMFIGKTLGREGAEGYVMVKTVEVVGKVDPKLAVVAMVAAPVVGGGIAKKKPRAPKTPPKVPDAPVPKKRTRLMGDDAPAGSGSRPRVDGDEYPRARENGTDPEFMEAESAVKPRDALTPPLKLQEGPTCAIYAMAK
ncbi:hypothetical protein ACFL6Y_03545, partial [Elusimicrobiota bacterium]